MPAAYLYLVAAIVAETVGTTALRRAGSSRASAPAWSWC